MKILSSGFFIAMIAVTSGSLLEKSQLLWTKLLEGGLTKIGSLDPLRVPVVKVDQSEGDTSYRMILRNVQIAGLNSSTLESVYVGRGRLKTNLTEKEAGYVSYTDQRELDTIRYRFHTVVKEPKQEYSENLQVEPIPGYTGSSRTQNKNGKLNSAQRSNIKTEREDLEDSGSRQSEMRRYGQSYKSPSNENAKISVEASERHETYGNFGPMRYAGGRNEDESSPNPKNIPGRVRILYAGRQNYPEDNYRMINQRFPATDRPDESSGCGGNCRYQGKMENTRFPSNQRRYDSSNRREDESGYAASTNFESRRDYQGSRPSNPGRNFEDDAARRNSQGQGNQGRYRESQRMENPGFVDIVYADEKDQKLKRFGNLRVEPGRDLRVYSLEDVIKDLRDDKRFIVHNFTEGESLTKKNDAIRTASETKRIRDLVRYAKDFQEKQGYYEEGMQLIYHYGNKEDPKDIENKRSKRAHLEDEPEDDIMHVILRARVPMLRVHAGYVLTGNVGKRPLRGDGLLSANFTELIGDFTLELKKLPDDSMIVRAARAKLTADYKKITLQGMDEEGPVKEVLTQGLMAAEAVAAMLADDLATKALSEKTADSIVYKMYKNLPTEN